MLGNLQKNIVNVQRPTPSKGTSGAEKDTYTTVYTAQACNIQPVSSGWKILYGQRKIDCTHTVYFPGSLTIKVGDKIIYGSRSFMVIGVKDVKELGVITEVDCQELRQP